MRARDHPVPSSAPEASLNRARRQGVFPPARRSKDAVEPPPDTIREAHIWLLYLPWDWKKELVCSYTIVLRGILLAQEPASSPARVSEHLGTWLKERAYSENEGKD